MPMPSIAASRPLRRFFQRAAHLSALCFLLAFATALRRVDAVDFVPSNAPWRFHLATESLPTAPSDWRAPAFDDTQAPWAQSQAPFHAGRVLSGTPLPSLPGKATGAYFRATFQVDDPAAFSELTLRVIIDDGFIAWINGKEVARYNVPDGDLSHTARAASPAPEPPAPIDSTLRRPWEFLVHGLNVLAIHALTEESTAEVATADFLFQARLEGEPDTTPPSIVSIDPPGNSTLIELETLEIEFSEPVRNVSAADLLLNDTPAVQVEPSGPTSYVFTFVPPPDGIASVRWAADHEIRDDTGRGNLFAGGAWQYKIDSSLIFQKVRINEFMAENDKSSLDEDREPSDWIELYNSSSSPVSLLGWSLTDDATLPRKWNFPDVTLDAGAYLVVWASEKNRTALPNRLHANFKLNRDGEYLALVAPDGSIASEFGPSFPPQVPNVSYGWVPGGDIPGYFPVATPGSANSSSGNGFAPAVHFSRTTGTFREPFQLELTTPGAPQNVVIHYSLDGRLPTKDSLRYTGPISISNTTEVRARAFADLLLPGEPRTETFLALNTAEAQLATYQSTLPILVISTLGRGTITASANKPVSFSLYEPVKGIASLTNPPTFATRGAAKVRGSSTEDVSGKSAWAIEWRDEFDQDAEHPILGMPAESEWVLYSPNVFDPVMIHNPFMYELSRRIGRYATRTRFVEVYQNRAGPIASNQWWGVYVLMEKISIGKERVSIPKLEPQDLQQPELSGSYLLKIDRLDPGDTGISIGGVTAGLVDPKEKLLKLPQRAPQLRYLQNYFSSFASALNGVNWQDPTRGYAAYIDVDSWIDHHWLNVLASNVDCLRLSTYFYKPRGGRIEYGPIWDFDRSLGSTDGRDSVPRRWGGGGSDYFFTYPWWGRLFTDPNFYQRYVDRYQELRASHFATTNLASLIQGLANQVRPSALREARRWTASRPRGGTYDNEVNLMRNWVSNRLSFIDGQFTQPPSLSHPGGRVAAGQTVELIPQAGSTIYYTLDGTDPRQTGATNRVSPKALRYEGPITLSANAKLVARGFNAAKRQRAADGPRMDTPWSRPVSATFVVSSPKLALSELHFQPEPAPSPSPWDPGDFEFVELVNRGDVPIDLLGYQFTAGITFAFSAEIPNRILAPGARLVVARNPEALLSRYPGIPAVAGPFTGSLANEGEQLTFVGPLGERIFSFEFFPKQSPLAAGAGFSLVLKDESTDPAFYGTPSRWIPSAVAGGSPGLPEPSVASSVPRVSLSEVVGNPAANQRSVLELFNPEATQVSIGGWYLSEDPADPRQYRFPSGMTLRAQSYAIFDENNLKPVKLRAGGGDLYLFSADSDGKLTGWSSALRYSATTPGQSVAQWGDFPAVTTVPTPGAANQWSAPPGPRISLLYASRSAPPANPLYEPPPFAFVQIHNPLPTVFDFFDPTHPDRTWRLRGDVDFDFPPNFSLEPGAVALIVNFDPARRLDWRAQFENAWGPVAPAPILGPWTGALRPSGGVVRLEKPIEPDPGDDPEFSVVDAVSFDAGPRATSPWAISETGDLALVRFRYETPGHISEAWTPAMVPGVPGQRDSNGNGLPDTLEVQLGLPPAALGAAAETARNADFDQDGITNYWEIFVGSEPLRADSGIHLIRGSNDGSLHYLRVALPQGKSAEIEIADRLDGASWTTFAQISVGSPVQTLPIRSASGARYFRYRILSQ